MQKNIGEILFLLAIGPNFLVLAYGLARGAVFLAGAALAAMAVPLFWYGVNTLKNHFGLSQLAIDARTRAIVDRERRQ